MEHADKVIDLYDDEKHRHVADLLNQDPKTTAGVCGSISTWVLGYPDRALLVRMSQRGIMCWMVAHSNFLVGGVLINHTIDTFFVDDRGPTSDIWSTVDNFHSGDAATPLTTLSILTA